MSTASFDGPSFQTAARRRQGRPLVCKVQHWEGDAEIDVELQFDPRLDMTRFGTAFGAFGKTLQQVENPDVDPDERLRILDRETTRVRAALRECLVPPSRLAFDVVSDAMDIAMLGNIVRWLGKELSGLDPTQPSSSSDGSDQTPTSPPSTDGAPLAVST